MRETLELYAGLLPRRRGRSARRSSWSGSPSAPTSASASSPAASSGASTSASALIGDPELLFLDEPTTGFDPSARHQAWDVVAGLRDLGKTIFLTTHYMDEAQRLADRVAIISAGRIVAEGRPDELGDRESRPATIRFTAPGRHRAAGARRRRGRRGADGDGELERDPRRPGRAPQPAHRLGARARRRARRARGRPAEPRGHLPRAHRRGAGGRPMSAIRLVGAPVPLRPEDVLAQPGVDLLHR